MKQQQIAIGYALAAALCYGLSAPVSKLLLARLSPAFLSALLYLGAGFGMLALQVFSAGRRSARPEISLSRRDIPLLAAMVLLDAAAPVLLLFGLQSTTPATVSLLNNFEIAATALIAWLCFQEAVGKRLWLSILLITAACILLTVEDFSALSFSAGALLALLASVCWGFENNTTRQLSSKNPLQIVLVKGLGSGCISLGLALWLGNTGMEQIPYVFAGLLLGVLAYGCSVYFYILAQRHLGAARTGIYYAFAPFIGVLLSFVLVGQSVGNSFWLGLGLMAAGSYLAATDQRPPYTEPPEKLSR